MEMGVLLDIAHETVLKGSHPRLQAIQQQIRTGFL
jgi:hypothetical protein